MSHKSIEIYYDIAAIPGISNRDEMSPEALAFRNAAMEHVERAVEAAGAGSWAGAEIGAGEVNFGFNVNDFDEAESTVREAVKGTRFESIREIVRNEFLEEDFAEAENMQTPLGFFGLIYLLIFRRMPKRFRQ